MIGYRGMDISKDYHGTQSVEELFSREVGRTMQEDDRITAFDFCKWCLFTLVDPLHVDIAWSLL